MTKAGKILLYIGQDITAHLTLNKVLPSLIDAGLEPVILLTGYDTPNRGLLPELTNISFYERKLLRHHIYPFIETLGHTYTGFSSPRLLANKYRLSYYHDVRNINNPELIAEISGDRAIIGSVSISCLQIFKETSINVLRTKGFLWNLHPGLLPDVRGLYAPLWAMNLGHINYGPTLHHVNTGVDTGRIIELRRQELDYSRSYLLNRIMLSSLNADIILNNIEKSLRGDPLIGWPQSSMEGEYYTIPANSDLEEFNRKNLQLVCPPAEMARLYMSLFRPDDEVAARQLQNIILKAVSDHEAEKKRQLQRVV